MSVPVLITAPTSCASSVIMTLNNVVGRTTSPFTLEDQAFRWPGSRWNIDFRLPPFTKRDIAAQWIAFGVKLEGSFNTFLMGDPSARLPRGVATGTPLIDGAAQTGGTLDTKGWTPSTTNIMRAGDYIQIGTGSLARLHMVLDDVNSSAGGLATLNIAPDLRYSPGNNDPIIVSNAKGVFRMAENSFSWSVDPGMVYRLSFQAVEVVSA